MKILVLGNMGSGKTTVLTRLRKAFPFEVVAVDDYRRKYGDGTEKGESSARQNLIKAIRPYKNQYIECIGLGKTSEAVFELLSKNEEPLICLKLVAPKEICERRLRARKWDIPFPQPLIKTSELIDNMDKRIAAGLIEEFWGKKSNTVILSCRNTTRKDIEKIAAKFVEVMKGYNASVPDPKRDVDVMLNAGNQGYYGGVYSTYQRAAVKRDDKLFKDRDFIAEFVSQIGLNGNLVDIGSGDCQWYPLVKNRIGRYFAVEINKDALLRAPVSKKLTPINKNVFNRNLSLGNIAGEKIDCALFSFFMSHFSDDTIRGLLKRMSSVSSLLIIDSLWSSKRSKRHASKDLREIKRKISENNYIWLPKRFFDFHDMAELAQDSGYEIINYKAGDYWFGCLMRRATP